MCTGVRVRAQDGTVVYGRTMEFGIETQSQIIAIPRGYTYTATSGLGKPGKSWQTQYAAAGANMLHELHLVDGVNEKGLGGGLFYFTDYAAFPATHPAQQVIAPWELLTFLLTTCATLAQVKDALAGVHVAPLIFPAWGVVPPVHLIVHDAQGASLVIEYVQGNLTLYDAPSGVITNSPTYDWHLTHLKEFSNLSPYNVAGPSLGQGSGMLGLPGDFTSPSRFVRATLWSESVIESPDAQQARDMVFHILSLFNIPKGVIRDAQHKSLYTDYTQWTTVSDLTHGIYYWHTYNNRQVMSIHLKEVMGKISEPTVIPLEYSQQIADLTRCLEA